MPGMDVLILACGGQSEVFVRQLIGRVLRITATKKHVVIIDFKDCCKYLAEHAENREAIYFSEEAFKVVTK
jgi:superfamily II DNA or RNA helicase